MTNHAETADRDKVNFAINGGGINPATGQPFSKLQHGDTCIIPAGTPPAWTSAITVDRNISVIGAGPDKTVITGGALWVITPVPADTHRVRISGMHWIRNSSGPLTCKIIGACPIDETNIGNPALSGGFRMDHIVCTSTTSATGGGKIYDFNGWLEGVVDHCVWDFDITQGTGATGEHCIVNHNRNPDGTGAYGAHSWSSVHTVSDWKQIYFENCIIKRRGGIDCNQWGGGFAGGARYTGRHCTSWGSIGSGHESRSDGAVSIVGGLRSSASYKNLFVRDGSDPVSQASNLTNVRAGENVTWGNRYNRFGGNAGSASSPVTFDAYVYSAWNRDMSYGGPDGANHWDDNASGNLNLNGSSQPAQSTDSAGSIYASGTSGVRTTGNLFEVSLSGMTSMPINKWKGFVIRNLSAVRDSQTPVSFGFIVSNNAGFFTIAASSQPNSALTQAQKQFNIVAGDLWEIRRVNTYFATVGAGKMDTVINTTNSGAYGTSTEPTLVDGTRRWTNQEGPGISQWDNKYTLALGSGFTLIDDWGGSAKYLHSARNVRNNVPLTNPHPNFSYDPNTAAGSTAGTLVGADAEAWSIAPATLLPSLQTGEGDSFHTDGTGGPTYPHPFVGTVPRINESTNTFSKQGGAQEFQLTTSNFSGTPSFSKTVSSVPSGATAGQLPTGITLSSGGKFAGDPVSAVAGSYQVTVTAAFGISETATVNGYNLIIKSDAAPTITWKSPADSSTFTAPASITLTAEATDDVGIASVSFYNGATLINSAITSSPYTTTWTSVPAGTYSLTAKATDTIGQTTTSSPAISVIVNTPSGVLLPPTIVVTA